MKRLFVLFVLSIIGAKTATAATNTPWWQQPTVCRLNPTHCYAGMGTGYDRELWDVGSNCWGMKIICADALSKTTNDPTPVGRTDIANGTGIKSDFDTSVLNGDCFGVRKTTENGSMTSVNGKYVYVWCGGILDNPDEYVANGEITYGTQPTCGALAQNGYVGVLNGKCYGKYYNPVDYYIDCNGSGLLPKRLIVLNGADSGNIYSGMPTDRTTADARFDKMQSTSKTQRDKYFKAK